MLTTSFGNAPRSWEGSNLWMLCELLLFSFFEKQSSWWSSALLMEQQFKVSVTCFFWSVILSSLVSDDLSSVDHGSLTRCVGKIWWHLTSDAGSDCIAALKSHLWNQLGQTHSEATTYNHLLLLHHYKKQCEHVVWCHKAPGCYVLYIRDLKSQSNEPQGDMAGRCSLRLHLNGSLDWFRP